MLHEIFLYDLSNDKDVEIPTLKDYTLKLLMLKNLLILQVLCLSCYC